MGLPSMSGWARIMACGAENRYPHERADVDADAGEFARMRGTAAHALMDHGDMERACAGYPEHADYLRKVARGALQEEDRGGWVREQARALDVFSLSARPLTVSGHRQYEGVLETEIPGTLDAWRVEGNTLYVRDYKTGRGAGSARNSVQLKLQALSVMLDPLWVHIGLVDAELQHGNIDDDGHLHVDAARMGPDDMAVFLQTVRMRATEYLAQGAVPYAGSWCTYCPARARCPEFNSPWKNPTGGFVDLVRTEPGAAYEQWQAVKQLEKHMQITLKKAVGAGGRLPLLDGKEWGPVQFQNRHFNAERVGRVLAGLLGPESVARALPPHTSKKLIMEACKVDGVAFSEVLEALEKAGAVELVPGGERWVARRPGERAEVMDNE